MQTLVAYRVFLALLPLILRADEPRRTAIICEAKELMLRYFAQLHEQ